MRKPSGGSRSQEWKRLHSHEVGEEARNPRRASGLRLRRNVASRVLRGFVGQGGRARPPLEGHGSRSAVERRCGSVLRDRIRRRDWLDSNSLWGKSHPTPGTFGSPEPRAGSFGQEGSFGPSGLESRWRPKGSSFGEGAGSGFGLDRSWSWEDAGPDPTGEGARWGLRV
jgi:hypothetical protein